MSLLFSIQDLERDSHLFNIPALTVGFNFAEVPGASRLRHLLSPSSQQTARQRADILVSSPKEAVLLAGIRTRNPNAIWAIISSGSCQWIFLLPLTKPRRAAEAPLAIHEPVLGLLALTSAPR
jgi:hypothetical protein